MYSGGQEFRFTILLRARRSNDLQHIKVTVLCIWVYFSLKWPAWPLDPVFLYKTAILLPIVPCAIRPPSLFSWFMSMPYSDVPVLLFFDGGELNILGEKRIEFETTHNQLQVLETPPHIRPYNKHCWLYPVFKGKVNIHVKYGSDPKSHWYQNGSSSSQTFS